MLLVRLCAVTQLFGQGTILMFRFDTLAIPLTDSIFYQNGDDLNGEVKFGNTGRISIVDIMDGYVTSYRGYDANGKMMADYTFDKRKLDGPFTEWWPNGELKVDGYYENGLAAGEWEYFYTNGYLETRGHYLPDTCCLLEKFEIVFHNLSSDEGIDEVIRKNYIQHSMPHGIWTFFEPDGTHGKSLIFDKGRLISMDVGDHVQY